jgi:hypothetical protein
VGGFEVPNKDIPMFPGALALGCSPNKLPDWTACAPKGSPPAPPKPEFFGCTIVCNKLGETWLPVGVWYPDRFCCPNIDGAEAFPNILRPFAVEAPPYCIAGADVVLLFANEKELLAGRLLPGVAVPPKRGVFDGAPPKLMSSQGGSVRDRVHY